MSNVPIYLSGPKPGVFDPTQPARLLRYPDSDLVFASFNPLAGGTHSSHLGRANRAVVEIPRSNGVERPNWYTFVPRAVLAAGVENEGRWPHVVNYCGRWVVCDQDQWDIHKLDPAYECVVPGGGMYPSIAKKVPAFPEGTSRRGKRTLSPSVDDDPSYAGKKARGAPPPSTPTPSDPSGSRTSNGTYPPAAAEDGSQTDCETSSTSTHPFSTSTSANGFASFTASGSLRSEGSLLSLTSLSSTTASSGSGSTMSTTSTSTVKPGATSSRSRARTTAAPPPPEARPPVTPKRPTTPAPRKSSAKTKRTNASTGARKKRTAPTNATPKSAPNVASAGPSNVPFTTSPPTASSSTGGVPATEATGGAPSPEARPRTPEIVDLTMDEDDVDVVMRSPSPSDPNSPPHSLKRKDQERMSSSDDLSGSPQGSDRAPKRSRAVSPGTVKAEYEKKLAQRKRDRERKARGSANEDQTAERTKQLWEDVMKNVQAGQSPTREPAPPRNVEPTTPAGQATPSAQAVPQPATPSSPVAEPESTASSASESTADPEEVRQASIRESQRKLAELEKDKPLWEEQAAQRAAQAEASAAAHRARQQDRQRAAEALAAQQANERAQAAAAAHERGRAAYERLEPQRHESRMQERQRWLPWSPQKALDRFIDVLDTFNQSRFSEDNQIDLLFLPWPVLHSPFTLNICNITWEMVEEFFLEARASMSTQDYKLLVSESRLGLHPDRWRARGVFTIYDERARAILHGACTRVSQALTPIWTESKTL